MAAVFRNWSRMGYAEGQSGHISVRDPEFPQIMWMNPLSRHYGTLTAGDMIPLEIDTGRIVGGNPNPATGKITCNKAGYYIHSAVHKRRPDIHAICHAHTHAGRAWSVFAKPLEVSRFRIYFNLLKNKDFPTTASFSPYTDGISSSVLP